MNKKLNICILDYDDRGAQSSFPYHYRKLGHNVYMPQWGTPGLDWERVLMWPRLLMKCQSDPTKRNVEIHGFKSSFGEDKFINTELYKMKLYDSDVSCDLVDFSKEKIHIDAFHTTSNSTSHLHKFLEFAKTYFPNAKWISSSFNHWDHNPHGFSPKNVCRQLPANYDVAFKNLDPDHSCNFYRHHTEFDLFDAPREPSATRSGFNSFNHNYHVRQPDVHGYPFFQRMNKILFEMGYDQAENYGGNIRGHGADVDYSDTKGLTGNYKTLSPRGAANLYRTSKAIVHFKNTDWAGGVPAYARFAGVPLITTQHFINMSHSNSTLINDYNCVVVNTPEEAAAAVIKVHTDKSYMEKLSVGMAESHNNLFENADYWNAWERMLSNLQ